VKKKKKNQKKKKSKSMTKSGINRLAARFLSIADQLVNILTKSLRGPRNKANLYKLGQLVHRSICSNLSNIEK